MLPATGLLSPTAHAQSHSAPKIEEAIRKQAARQGVPINHFLAPFLEAIADGRLVMMPHFPPSAQQGK